MVTLTLTRQRVILLVAAFVAVLGLAATGVVLGLSNQARASHLHSDVDTGNFFHDEISWLVNNGIANGFDNGTFDPNGSIKRQQAALWFANYNAAITTRSSSTNPPAGAAFSNQTTCPTGQRAIAGGGTTSSSNLFITDSRPLGTGWSVRWESDNDVTADPSSITVYATCVPANP